MVNCFNSNRRGRRRWRVRPSHPTDRVPLADGTIRTGSLTALSTSAETLPTTRRFIGPSPRLPITTKPTPRSPASPAISSAGRPSLRCDPARVPPAARICSACSSSSSRRQIGGRSDGQDGDFGAVASRENFLGKVARARPSFLRVAVRSCEFRTLSLTLFALVNQVLPSGSATHSGTLRGRAGRLRLRWRRRADRAARRSPRTP
jgi:hypothetical protein